MCGRIFIQPGAALNVLLSGLGLGGVELPKCNNLAPTEAIPVIRQVVTGQSELTPMRWWLHPGWSREPPNQKFATFNARIETIQASPTFRGPIKHQRGIVPASAFVEWQAQGKQKQPLLIEGTTAPLALAAIWDVWQGELYSCAIITQPANESFSSIHQRMPLALTLDQAKEWLDPQATAAELLSRLRGSCVALSAKRIDAAVNNARNKGDAVLLPS
ncbi:MAG TPA: SOS response-associated peptidase [Halioglobus sp.]